MYKSLAFVLLSVTSAMAQQLQDDGRWRPLWHASNSFGIIWAIVGIVLLIFILKNLSKLPSASSRGPYISLAIITFTFVVYYVLWGAIEWAKESTMTFVSVNSAYAAMNFLSAILVAFLPATILYIIQKRGALLRAAVGGDSLPISCRPWKKILDWFLVGATFCTLITLMALNIAVFRAIADMTIYFDKKLLYTEVRRGVGHAAVALGISLCLDVIVSLFIQSRQANRAKTPDPVIRRLLIVAAPFIAAYAISSLIFDIYQSVVSPANSVSAVFYYSASMSLAAVLINGVCKVGVIATLISTMTLPNAQWIPERFGGTSGSESGTAISESWHHKSKA